MKVILALLGLAILIQHGHSEEKTACPDSHPFAYYYGGIYCCAYGYEKTNSSLGAFCDGSRIGRYSSLCCKDDAYIVCPDEWFEPCIDSPNKPKPTQPPIIVPPTPENLITDQETIDSILKCHNDLRRKVAKGEEKRGSNGPQPAATNMKELKWDTNIAKLSQALANSGKYKHVTHTQGPHGVLGQNLMFTSAETSDVCGAVRDWYQEVDYFNKDNVAGLYKFPDDGTVGHYTQVVWADTEYVGCGFWYSKGTKGRGTIFVCDYGPGGNVNGGQVYKTTGKCPDGYKLKDGLCAK